MKPEEVWELTQFEIEVLWDAALERNGWRPEGVPVAEMMEEELMDFAGRLVAKSGKKIPEGVERTIGG